MVARVDSTGVRDVHSIATRNPISKGGIDTVELATFLHQDSAAAASLTTRHEPTTGRPRNDRN